MRAWNLITNVLVLGLIAGGTAACAGEPAAAPVGAAVPPTAPSASASPSSSASPSAPRSSSPRPSSSAATRTTAAKAKAAGSGDPRFGTQYAILESSNPSTRRITYDLIDWFNGKQAEKACAEDGVKPAENDYCLAYYSRNHNKQLRTLTVDPDASIRIMDTGVWKTVDLRTFLTKVRNDNVIRFDIDANRIVKLDQIYLP
ncbi:hypothetical protein [Krasilnikovia sp. MM14-A1004]|uniref:hypothetical protein n=1 Tax=Krasilnikovia sp. MM14-A1004 TaxID=3373541 RepID=UPI00399CF7E2